MNINKMLNDKKGNAFYHLEEQFWIKVLKVSLSKTKGNVFEASELLGISRTTFTRRCTVHGVDANKYRDADLRAKKHKMDEKKTWFKQISRVFKDETISISQAARDLNWSRGKLQSRMKQVGYKR